MLPLIGETVLQDKAILIIEDNLLLALDLSNVVGDYGGRPIGPVATTADALRTLENEVIDAVVLDCQIADEDIVPIVMFLAERGLPVLITSITAPPPVIAEVLPDAPILRVPIQPEVALTRLVEEVGKKESGIPRRTF